MLRVEARSSRAGRAFSSAPGSAPGDVGAELDVLERRERREEVERLEDERDGAAPEGEELATGRVGQIPPAHDDRPARRGVERADDVQQRRLAAARRPEDHAELAGAHAEGDVVERDDVRIADAIAAAGAAQLDQRFARTGGGLLSGILVAVKSQRPDVRIIGVEPTGANIVTRSREEGRLITPEKIDTVADGLAAPFAGEVTQPIIDALVDDMVLVEDSEILAALRLIIERCKIVVEPAGAAATAALMAGKVTGAEGTRTVTLLSGGNIDLSKLANFLTV